MSLSDYETPASEISPALEAFPAHVIGTLLPPEDLISDTWWSPAHALPSLTGRWFHEGLPHGTRFIPKGGIDPTAALRHVMTIMRSFEPKHEHKVAGVAMLLGMWFTAIYCPDPDGTLIRYDKIAAYPATADEIAALKAGE